MAITDDCHIVLVDWGIMMSSFSSASGFGLQLRSWRARRRITLRELARLVHVDYGHLGKVERGTRSASQQLVEACETHLKCDGALMKAWRFENPENRHRPAQLPAIGRALIGRQAELRRVAKYLETRRWRNHSPVIVIDGPPGVGKTTVAMHAAAEVSDNYPDGTLFADLRGFSELAVVDATDVLEQFLLTLGVPAVSIPHAIDARAALYRSVLHHRRVLVVLDNVRTSQQIRPLLPSGPGCGAIVTSRTRLSGLTVHHGAIVVGLPPLRPDDAIDVLRSIVGDERVATEFDSATTIALQCSGLPLALCVAAERVASRPQTTLADLADDLLKEAQQLALLTAADDNSLDVRRVFSWSYRSLDLDPAYLFRCLSLACGTEISLEAAATMAGWTIAQTRPCLDVLTGSHLLEETGHHRYRFHDLLRVYATELCKNEDDDARQRAAADRLLRWYLASVHSASQVMAPYRSRPKLNIPVADLTLPQFDGWADTVAWYERELPALTLATKRALGSGVPAVAHDLPIALWDYFFLRKPWPAWISMNANGLVAARQSKNTEAEAWVLYNLGVAHLDLGEFDQATARLTDSLRLRRRLGARDGQGWSLLYLGNVHVARGEFAAAADLLEQALALFVSIGDQWATGFCRGYLGRAYTLLERYDDALTQLMNCEQTLRGMGYKQGEGCVLDQLAKVHLAREEWTPALTYLHRAANMRESIGDRQGQAGTLLTLGKVYQNRRELAKARESLRLAHTLFAELGDPDAAEVKEHLQLLDDRVE